MKSKRDAEAALTPEDVQKILSICSPRGLLVGGQALATVTGLASGETEPTGWWWALVLASLVICTFALVEIGTAGVLLVRDVFTGAPT